MLQYKTVCNKDMCSGCMACVDSCEKKAIRVSKNLKSYNAIIDTNLCVNCGRCINICQQNTPPEFNESIAWYQGWAKDSNLRQNSSSGGFATEIARSFIENKKGVVVSCKFSNGEFVFDVCEDINQVHMFSGSKYIKSNPINAYKTTKSYLLKGKEVLFVGLPCQVAAVINFAGKRLSEKLYTVDLICHGSPDPSVMDIFLRQHHTSLKKIGDIRFRIKNDHSVTEKYKYIVDKDIIDCYTMIFLKGFCFTTNCYSCQYAKRQRVSDITIGDSWGSELPQKEKDKGISLALCQTEKGLELLKKANLKLLDVNYEKACTSNKQLNHPFQKPEKRELFLTNIEEGKNFDIETFKIFPVLYIKLFIKMILKKLKLYRGAGINSYAIIASSVKDKMD